MSSSLAAMSAMDAPMSSSLGAMGPLLRKLDSLLPPDYRLPKLLKDRIQLLKADLEEISVPLLEQSTADSPDEMAKYWMDEVRELLYDIEDFIDGMMSKHADAKTTSVKSYKVGRVKIAWLPKTALKPRTRAARIAELRAMVRESIARHDTYLDGRVSRPRSVFTGRARVPVLYAGAADGLIGVDRSKMKLIEWLTDEEDFQQLKVVAIVGPAGVGKTMLAKQVYHELGEQFECRAFVRASRKPDIRRLLGGILSQVQGYRCQFDSCTVQDIIDNLNQHLQDKRYVIVIDDLWETTAWDIVASAFPEGNNHSRIITTAEIEGVALGCCHYQSNNIFEMKPLGREDSTELLFSLVFGPEVLCPEELKGILDIIITKCAGLPLATICVAGLLTSQPGNTELWQHMQESLCSNLSTNSTLEETVQEVLKLSYNSLPHYLKTCLMHLGMYPEGYTMWKVDLVKQWIAEGYIGATEGTEIGEVADSYFGELVNRGMIQPVDINYNAEVLSCTLRNVVLDLITHESNEVNFITALDYSQTVTGLYSKARRLSLHCSNTRYAMKPTGPTLPKVRSIGFFGILECVPSFVEFKLLRVLILEFWGDHRGNTGFNLTRICRLVQLRFLKISCDASVEVELPTQVRMLRYLETLIIDAVVSAVPLDIIHLPGLWHLSLGNKIDLPDEIGRIRSLRTLHYFDVRSNSEDNILSIGDLMNLQDLHITYYKELDEHPREESDEHLKRKLRALASSLAKLVNLKSVTLAPDASGTTIYLGVQSSMPFPPVFLQRLELLPPICIFSRLPEWIGQLQRLCILKVVVSELLMKDMDMLIGLPALTILSLYVRQPTAESIIFKRRALVGLKYFQYTCGVLPLTFQEESFPNLQRLELSFNAHRGVRYDRFLSGIDYLLNLKEIVGTIGAAAGAEEPDRRAAESAFKDAIRKHPKFPSYDNVKRIDRVCEEYQLRTQEKDSSSEKYEILQKEHTRKEGDSSGDQFRILPKETEEDTKQHSDRVPARKGESRGFRMSCFSFFGTALEAEDGKKPVPADDAKDTARKDGSAPRGSGSDKLRPQGGLDSKKDHLTIPRDGSSQNIAAQIFTFRELAAATKNFRQDSLLGEGGFGRVYKGRLDNGQAVAVKQLDRNGLQGNREFLVEVLMLSHLHHTNLVNLIGYCADGDQRLLVYEFMPLGSLEDHLHDVPPEKEALDWNTRMKIAAGAAKGLEHLHDKASPPVIYRDFKSSNILLGEGFHPKLSDFGLAKLGPVGDKTHVSTRVMATYGYCAPEYAMTGQFTVKSNIYSFGVVLLELITGRKAIDNTKPQGEQNLVAWASPLFKDRRKFPEMADPMLQGRFPMRGLYQALAVSAMCLQEEAMTRPHIGDVVTALSYLASQTYDPNTPSRSNSSTSRARYKAARASKYGGEVSGTSSTGGSGWRSGLDDMDMAGSPAGSPAQTGRRREA